MPKAKGTRISIYIGEELAEDLDQVGDRINKSRVAAEALEREVKRAKEEIAQEAYKEAQADYVDTLRRTPLLVDGLTPEYPPDIAKKVAAMPPYKAEGYARGWDDARGTINAWPRGSQSGHSGGAVDPFTGR